MAQSSNKIDVYLEIGKKERLLEQLTGRAGVAAGVTRSRHCKRSALTDPITNAFSALPTCSFKHPSIRLRLL